MAEEQLKISAAITSPEERVQLVSKIIEQTPTSKLTSKYLDLMTQYIIDAVMTKDEKKQKKILTQNRRNYMNQRETSFQGLASKFEQGEDGIYSLIVEEDKNIIFKPKDSITEENLEQIPVLKEWCDIIKQVEQKLQSATGRQRYLLKKQINEMWYDAYIIRSVYQQPIRFVNVTHNSNDIDLVEDFYIDENGDIQSTAQVNLLNPDHISALLRNYSKLKAQSWGVFSNDFYYLMQDLDTLVDAALANEPVLKDIVIYKIDGRTNEDIQSLLQGTYGTTYSIEYISSLWRKKIPKLIAEYEQKRTLTWYYTEKERGRWKKCSRCGEIKLAHKAFFSKNSSSKDHFYSICKDCRAAKYQEAKKE